MKKTFLFPLVALAALALGFGVLAACHIPTAGDMLIATPGSAEKPPVMFDHERHAVMAAGKCALCHHIAGGEKKQACTACHTAQGGDDAVRSRTAFHKLCNSCHVKQDAGPRYPRDCPVCHAHEPPLKVFSIPGS